MKNKKIIISVAFILLINTIIVVAWWGLFSSILEQKGRINSARRDLALSEQEASASTALKKLMDGMEEDIIKINSIFINRNSLIVFIKQLENLSEQTGASMEINSITMNEKDVSGPRLNLELSGKFKQIIHYLSLLENIPYQTIINKAAIQAKKTGKNTWAGDTWTTDVDLVLVSFIYEKI